MIRVGIIILFSLFVFSFPTFAQTNPALSQTPIILNEDIEADASTESAEVVEETIQYELPYPGMLPDHPLYFLKTIRDAVVRFLISDPIKKTDFDILTSDKRIFAAKLLAEQKKYDMALESLSKSNNYLHEAVFSISKAKESESDITSSLGKLDTAVKKHQEVVSREIEPLIPENQKEALMNENKRLNDIEKSVSKIDPK